MGAEVWGEVAEAAKALDGLGAGVLAERRYDWGIFGKPIGHPKPTKPP